MKIYRELSSTLDLHKEEMLKAVHNSLEQAQKVVNKPGNETNKNDRPENLSQNDPPSEPKSKNRSQTPSTGTSGSAHHSDTLFNSDSDNFLAGDSDLSPPEENNENDKVADIRIGDKRYLPDCDRANAKRPRK